MKASARRKKHTAPAKAVAKNRGLCLRTGDQETARVVAVHDRDGLIVGAGCLLDTKHILTCRHVVAAAPVQQATGLRRALLARFPYAIHFLESPDRIVVLAVFHAKRDPRNLTGRS